MTDSPTDVDPADYVRSSIQARWSARGLLRAGLAAVRLCHQAAPREMVLVAVLEAVLTAALFLQVLVWRRLFEVTLAGEGSIMSPALVLAITMGLASAGGVAVVEGTRLIGERVERLVLGEVLDVAARVDLRSFEEVEFFDVLTRAEVGGRNYALEAARGLLSMLTGLAGALGIAGALLTLQPILLPLLLLLAVPLLLVGIVNSRAYYDVLYGLTRDDRRRAYLSRLLVGRAEAKEIRAYDLAPFVRSRYDRLWDERLFRLGRAIRARALRGVVAATASSTLLVGLVVFVVLLSRSNRLDLAAAGTVAVTVVQLGGRLRMLTAGAGSLHECSLFFDDYRALQNIQPTSAGRATAAEIRRVEVRDLTFTYPSGAEPVLNGITLDVTAGEVVALVGPNGSGKTTLAKVLVALYPADGGTVRWIGVDNDDLAVVRASTAIIFQDFVRYALTASDNVRVGRWTVRNDSSIESSAAMAGADELLRSLPEGYQTLLGREFGGATDLSGGEWQRVALARIFLRNASVVILDEPSAALDPGAEADLIARVRTSFHDRCVVLVSHRLSTVQHADRVYVLDRGRVVESGTHTALSVPGTRYSELFRLHEPNDFG
jgi:ATP-binding cassette, subfamily B, bacterial